MREWKLFCERHIDKSSDLENMKVLAREGFKEYFVYPDSINFFEGSYFFIAKDGTEKVLIVYGESPIFSKFKGISEKVGQKSVKLCVLTNRNCNVLRGIFPYTSPSNHKGKEVTIGLGDRLGLASAGHIRLIKGMPVFPVLAQQSIRELNLTGRTYEDVLCAAAWSVFQEGYTKGFGADGDHLKTEQEVQMALDCGFTMITLDCSEHIDNMAATMSESEVNSKYQEMDVNTRKYLESKYLGKEFILQNSSKIVFDVIALKRAALVYFKAISFTIEIYNNVIKGCGREIDFEMSIDETLTSTIPESHFFVASELVAGEVEITSLAPRFCGEFQKGIDYRGDKHQFELEFTAHVEIANYFGYKISVHSGSDKFSIFPIVGEKTFGKYHLKTAGTNWLEAVRIIASQNASLYRKIHKFAIENLNEAKKYYHISAEVKKVPNIDLLKDCELPELMNIDDARQVLHITYGLILSAKNADGSSVFKDAIYSTLNENEDNYYCALQKHIGKHMELLGIN